MRRRVTTTAREIAASRKDNINSETAEWMGCCQSNRAIRYIPIISSERWAMCFSFLLIDFVIVSVSCGVCMGFAFSQNCRQPPRPSWVHTSRRCRSRWTRLWFLCVSGCLLNELPIKIKQFSALKIDIVHIGAFYDCSLLHLEICAIVPLNENHVTQNVLPNNDDDDDDIDAEIGFPNFFTAYAQLTISTDFRLSPELENVL